MMGHREKLKGGDEYDGLTKARHDYFNRPGAIKRVKRKFWKRIRSKLRQVLKGWRS